MQLRRLLTQGTIKNRAMQSVTHSRRNMAMGADAHMYETKPLFTIDDKTTVAFTLSEKSGALPKALSTLVDNGLEITRIESKPSLSFQNVKEVDYTIDIEGSSSDAKVKSGVESLKAVAKGV